MITKRALAFATVLTLATGSMASAADIFDDTEDASAYAQNTAAGASPVFAQARTANARSVPAARRGDGSRRPGNPAHQVYDNQGRYLGSDPDPHVRSELARVPPGRDG